MRKRLSDKAIVAAKPSAVAYDIADPMTHGLKLRVLPSGTKTWSFRHKQARVAIGLYPAISLARAREIAAELIDAVATGKDPRSVLRPSGPGPISFAEAVDRWARDRKAKGRRSVDATKRLLDLHAAPLFDLSAGDINRREIVALLEDLRDTKGFTAQVNRTQTAISGVFSYLVNKGLLEHHPVAGLEKLVKEESEIADEEDRKRVLSFEELVAVWRAAGEMPSLIGPAVKLLILTGARREEVTRMTWDEIDIEARTWTIPASRTKTRREYVVPLAPETVETLKQVPRQRGHFVFSTDGQKPFAGWRRAVEMLRKLAGLGDHWTIHDLRRSMATGLGEYLNIAEETVARILNHSPKTRLGITSIYERSRRLDVMRSAVEAWARLVTEATEGEDKGATVVTLAGRR